MKKFPPDIRFQYRWRKYQAQLLKDLEVHLSDSHLNIVAAPGSGKTIIGLEVMRRINAPTLVIVPSISIREQWISRFVEHFLQKKKKPDWISNSLKKPNFFTVTTYQSINSIMKQKETKEQFLRSLKAVGISTIILDEAHHLRKEWWKSIMTVKNNSMRSKVISLTATPPYDVSAYEWEKYSDLCGSIDAEISVPELVKEKNLCPHQDFIFLNTLSKEEKGDMKKFSIAVQQFEKSFFANASLFHLIKKHRFLQNTEGNIEEIIKNIEYFKSMIIIARKNNIPLEKKIFTLFPSLQKKISEIFFSSYSLQKLEIFCSNFLHEDQKKYSLAEKKIIRVLKKKLRKIQALDHKKVCLLQNKKIQGSIKSSINKIQSIVSIAQIEYQNLGNNLRMVILTDFVRKDLLNIDTNKLQMGAIPIFLALKKKNITPNIAVLTGSMVILNKNVLNKLYEICEYENIPKEKISIIEIDKNPGFFQFLLLSSASKKMISVVTQLFSIGKIEVLIGTKSLLGEGWDAPVINSLVLASFVGSFMLSNQMRGRAIRIDPKNSEKFSNIWHLASIENTLQIPHDIATLERRFRAFIGPYYQKKSLENGIKRMALPDDFFSEKNIEKYNNQSKILSSQRKKGSQQWEKILESGKIQKIIPEVELQKNVLFRQPILYNTWRGVLGGIGFFSALFSLHFWIQSIEIVSLQSIELISLGAYASQILLAIVFFLYLPRIFKIGVHLFQYGYEGTKIKTIAQIILETLLHMGEIQTPEKKLSLCISSASLGKKKNEKFSCTLQGATLYETSIFLDTFEEIFLPICNSRYLLQEKTIWEKISATLYYRVPKVFGTHKKNAQFFTQLWKKNIGKSAELIYTRNKEGRKILLKAREKNFFVDHCFFSGIERKESWK